MSGIISSTDRTAVVQRDDIVFVADEVQGKRFAARVPLAVTSSGGITRARENGQSGGNKHVVMAQLTR